MSISSFVSATLEAVRDLLAVGSNLVTGSGNVVTRQQDVADFSAVDVGSAFKVNLTQGDSFGVSISADDNLFDRISVSKEGETLKIGLARGFNLRGLTTLKAEITMPELDGVRLHGAARGTLGGFRSFNGFDVDLSGASSLSGDVEAANTEISLSGASRLTLKGSASSIRLKASGASSLDLADFAADRASVTISGASSAMLNVKEVLDPVTLSGASRLVYLGDSSVKNISTSGASTIERR